MDLFEEYHKFTNLYGGVDFIDTENCIHFDNARDFYRFERYVSKLELEALIRDNKHMISSAERGQLRTLLDYFIDIEGEEDE